ncbi:hypothetical protein V1509DRAFT_677178 [Lipomyces kononenkoae]
MAGHNVFLRNYRRLLSLVIAIAVISIVIVAASTQASSQGIATLAKHIKPLLSKDDDCTRRGTADNSGGFAALLAAHDRPMELLRYCNRPSVRQFDDAANFLVSINGPEGTIARMKFGLAANERYNPNLLPYPVGSKHPYIGFARQSPKNGITHHEIVYCDMEWGETPVIGRRILQCVEPASAQGMLLPEAKSPSGSCLIHKFLEPIQGHSDPRVFFSPLGEPLMVVGTNGRTNCLGQYVVDLRTVIQGLSENMNLTNVPVRYSNLTELPREDLRALLYDENNEEYVHHHIMPRSISKGVNGSNILSASAQELPGCMQSALQDFSKSKDEANDYHQATNSLRVTMCEFPCVPTIHNTVLIIGRTNNLMFAGLDEQMMLYTVSMIWDKSFHARPEWSDATAHGAIQANDTDEYVYDSSSTDSKMQSRNKLADEYYHGWIDDTVMINIGVDDRDAAVLHAPMRDVLDCILLCD